jgi:hypothetical protein
MVRPLHGVLLMLTLTQRVIDELRLALPPVFAGTSIDELTGGAINWGTIQNKRSHREIPDECFVRTGQRVLVRRDLFLNWWAGTLSEARQPFGKPPRATPPLPRAEQGSPRRRPKAAEASPAGG